MATGAGYDSNHSHSIQCTFVIEFTFTTELFGACSISPKQFLQNFGCFGYCSIVVKLFVSFMLYYNITHYIKIVIP